MRKQSGFSLFEVVIVVVVIGLIGGVGYMLYTNFIAPKTDEITAIASPSPSPSLAPVTVTSSSELDTVSSQLDSITINDSDSGVLDTSTNF